MVTKGKGKTNIIYHHYPHVYKNKKYLININIPPLELNEGHEYNINFNIIIPKTKRLKQKLMSTYEYCAHCKESIKVIELKNHKISKQHIFNILNPNKNNLIII